MIRTFASIIIAALFVSACGARVMLAPKAGQSLPVKPEGAIATPNADQLITPSTQAKPERSDEQLKRSEERRDDKFDLPPPGK